jgi:NitT/TauT family transport system substrate-binding protein
MRIRPVLFAVPLLVPLLVACGSDDEPGAEADASCETVTVATLDDDSHRAAMYAIDEGLVTSDVVKDVELEYLQIPALIQATAGGQYDVISTSLPGVLLARQASGQDLRIVGYGAVQAGEGMAIYVKEGSDISSPEDLAGRTLGVPSFGASTTMQTQMVLAEGYDLAFPLEGGDISWVELDPPTLLNAVQKGDVDAALLFYQAAWEADRAGGLAKIAQVDQEYSELAGGTLPIGSVFVADGEQIDANPECMEAFQALLEESADYAESNIADFAGEIAEVSGVDAEYVTYWWDPAHYQFAGAPDAEWNESAEQFYELAVDNGVIPEAPDLSTLVSTPADGAGE